MLLDFFHQPGPSLKLARAGGFIDRNLKVREFQIDLFPREHIQTTGQNGGFQHGRLRPIESSKWGVIAAMQRPTEEPRANRVILDMIEFKLSTLSRSCSS